MRFIDAYDVILLDQGKTFMFENDRFGPQEDYADTYRRVGGTALSPTQIRDTVEHVYSTLLKSYRDRYCDDDFPTVKDVIKTHDPSFPSAEADYIDDVIAEHEIGPYPIRTGLRSIYWQTHINLVSSLTFGGNPLASSTTFSKRES